MPKKRALAAALLLLALGLCLAAAAQRENLPTQGKVVSVYDGDTLTVEAQGEKFSCRLLGIDTPEMSYARLWTEMEKVEVRPALGPEGPQRGREGLPRMGCCC